MSLHLVMCLHLVVYEWMHLRPRIDRKCVDEEAIKSFVPIGELCAHNSFVPPSFLSPGSELRTLYYIRFRDKNKEALIYTE
jgi:hypothetical protein